MAATQRHQVFISSTFRDLQTERRVAQQAVLELDCFPAGMELFPASDTHAWQLIKSVIDRSDYYMLIVGNRYGSVDVTGLSFTEKEYRYAREMGIPVLAFLHAAPDDLSVAQSDIDPTLREQLRRFRQEVEQSHHCKYWRTADELGRQISASLLHAMQSIPRAGWIRADQVPIAGYQGSIETVAGLDPNSLSFEALDALVPPLVQGESLGYDILCSVPLNFNEAYGDPAAFATDIHGTVYYEPEFSQDKGGLAGYVEATRLRLSAGLAAGCSLDDLFDAPDAGLAEAYFKLFDEDSMTLRADIDVTFRPEDGHDILFLRRLELLPLHRRRRVGLAIVRAIIENFGGDCGMVVGFVWPLTYEAGREEKPWEQHLDLVSLRRPGSKAAATLTKYFGQIGFNRVPETDLIYFDTTKQTPSLKKILRVE